MTKRGPLKVPLNVSVSPGVRRLLADACEQSGRTLTGEVEARLRRSLRAKSSDRLILLCPDDGLMAHLIALSRAHFVGDFETTMIFMLRTQMLDYYKSEFWRKAAWRHLTEPYRTACQDWMGADIAKSLPQEGKTK